MLRLSHTIQEVCHRFFILFKGSEAISEPSRHLTVAYGCFREVTTLSEDLLSVGVVRFVHADIIGTGEDGSGSNRDTLPTVHQGFSMIHSAAPILNKKVY